MEPKSPWLPCKQVNLTVAPSVGNENSEAGSGESFLTCYAKRGHRGVSHKPVTERRYVELSEEWALWVDTGADLEIREGYRDALGV